MSATPTNGASRRAGSPRLSRQRAGASRLAEVVDTAESPAKESSTIQSPTPSAPSAAEATLESDSACGSHAPGGDRSLIRYAGSTLELTVVPATAGSPGVEISNLLTTIGVIALDPGFTNTGSTTSAVTYIDGDAGVLRYRGYPIEQLAQSSTFVETSYLLIHGELPSATELDAFTERISRHTMLHEDLKRFFDGFPRDAHPMPVLSSAVSALSTFYQDALDPFNAVHVELSTMRLLAAWWTAPPARG